MIPTQSALKHTRRHSRLARLARVAVVPTLVVALGLPLATSTFAATPSSGAPGAARDDLRHLQCADLRADLRSTRTLGAAKAVGNCMANERLAFLQRETTVVERSASLTSSDRAALLAIFTADEAAIRDLKSKLDTETTVAGVRADVTAIVRDYRIYALVGPQTSLVRAADALSAAVVRLQAASTRLAADIAAAQAAGKDVTAAQASLTAMNGSIAQAQSALVGVSAEVLALTPADYNAGTAKPVLLSARSAVTTARAAVVSARGDAAAIRTDLGI